MAGKKEELDAPLTVNAEGLLRRKLLDDLDGEAWDGDDMVSISRLEGMEGRGTRGLGFCVGLLFALGNSLREVKDKSDPDLRGDS